MSATHDNFIGIYQDAYSQEYCATAIKYFEDMAAAGFAVDRRTSEGARKLEKDDLTLFCHDMQVISANNCAALSNHFNTLFWEKYYREYTNNFSILDSAGTHGSYHLKIQKTNIGGGYHGWHFESGSRSCANRILAWMLYLNDVEEGGETEFLYLHKRIKPKAGTLLIWPAGFTHTHRGNPPLSNNKYIITGWVEF